MQTFKIMPNYLPWRTAHHVSHTCSTIKRWPLEFSNIQLESLFLFLMTITWSQGQVNRSWLLYDTSSFPYIPLPKYLLRSKHTNLLWLRFKNKSYLLIPLLLFSASFKLSFIKACCPELDTVLKIECNYNFSWLGKRSFVQTV